MAETSELVEVRAQGDGAPVSPDSAPRPPPVLLDVAGRDSNAWRGLKLDQRALLAFYDDPRRPLSIQEVQKALQVTYKPAYQALTSLASRGVLAEERNGWARHFKPDLKSPACAREFVQLEWARREQFLAGREEAEQPRILSFVRRCDEEATPFFIRATSLEGLTLLVALGDPGERSAVAAIGRETGLSVATASVQAVRHILAHRPELAQAIARGFCLQGAEAFVEERFRALAR